MKQEPICETCGERHNPRMACRWQALHPTTVESTPPKRAKPVDSTPPVESTKRKIVDSTRRKPKSVDSTHDDLRAVIAGLREELAAAKATLAVYQEREERQRKSKREHIARKREQAKCPNPQ